jgi:hypothetical protein
MRFQGKRVSRQWHRVLTEASYHVKFTLDSGQRTMLEQLALVREKGVWSWSNPHGAAFPSPNAPHIRVGRQNHCLDINSLDGGQKRLADYLAKHGVHVVFNVPPEPWHMDPVNPAELRSFYRRLKAQDKRRHG